MKLYENESYRRENQTEVLSCETIDGKNWIRLKDTIFFPEEGGQYADTGILRNGDVTVRVLDGQLKQGEIFYLVDQPLEAGAQVECVLDWEQRFMRMQQHTGEHILTGLIHRHFGYNNVGFHLSDESPVTLDLDGMLTAEQIARMELLANEIVYQNLPVTASYPSREELPDLTYRSKIEIEGQVRLITIGEAQDPVDVCACCAPHVARTGEVGLIKILSFQHYKGGMRLAVACGQRACEAIAAGWADAEAAGRLLSVPVGRLEEAVGRFRSGESQLKQRLAALQNTLSGALADAAVPGQPFAARVEGADGDGLRRMAAAVANRTGAPCCLLAPGGQGLAYALAAAPDGDVRPACKALNEAFRGRGGGKAGFCQGSLADSDPARVLAFLAELL